MYTGNISVTPSDPWQDIIRYHDGDGSITFKAGVYVAVGDITIKCARSLDVRSEVLGGALIVGRWAYANCALTLVGFDLDAGPTGLFAIKDSYFDAYDLNVNLSETGAQFDTLGQFSGGVCRFSARNRNTVFDVKSRCKIQLFDIDSCHYKWAAGSGEQRIQLLFQNKITGIVLDAAQGLFTGTEIFGPGKGLGSGIELRRQSTACLSVMNRFENLAVGLRTRQGARAFLDDGIFRNCTSALRKLHGKIAYTPSAMIFEGNTNDYYADVTDVIEP